MMTLEQIQAALSDRRIDKVSEATGVPYNTVRHVRDSPTANPTWKTMRALSEYFQQGSGAKK